MSPALLRIGEMRRWYARQLEMNRAATFYVAGLCDEVRR